MHLAEGGKPEKNGFWVSVNSSKKESKPGILLIQEPCMKV